MRGTARVAAGILIGILLLVAAPEAGAHAVLIGSEPASGAVVASAPARVVLRFNEAPDRALSAVHVLDATGRAIETGPMREAGPAAVSLPLPPRLPDGAYTVSWRVVSTVDGHLTAGTFAFGVGKDTQVKQPPTQTVGTTSTPPSPVSVAGRFGLATGVVLLLGAPAASLLIMRRTPPATAWGVAAAWLFAWTGFGIQVAAETSRAGVSLGDFLGSSRGSALLRVGIALALAGAAAAAVSIRAGTTTFGLLGVTAAATMVMQSLAGHAGAGGALQVAVQSLHLVAIGIWIGGLVWLLTTIRGDSRREDVIRFARIAGPALAVVLLTGVARSLKEVGSISATTGTSFGRTVLIKLALFVPLAALGAKNHFRVVPRIAAGAPMRALGRAVTAEVAIAAVIFGAAGVLTELPPPATVRAAISRTAAAAPKPLVLEGFDFATTVRVRLSISPGAPGINTFDARITDYDTGGSVDAHRVTVTASLPARRDIAPATLSLAREGPAWTARAATLAIEGEWALTLSISRPARSVQVRLTAVIRAPRLPVQISRAQGQPTLYTAQLANGRTVQVYADPGAPGPNQVHITFFDGDGSELSLSRATVALKIEGGEAVASTLQRAGPGHFTANARMAAGKHRLSVQATTTGGESLTIGLDFTIEGKG